METRILDEFFAENPMINSGTKGLIVNQIARLFRNSDKDTDLSSILSLDNPIVIKKLLGSLASTKIPVNQLEQYNYVSLSSGYVKSLFSLLNSYSDDDLKTTLSEKTTFSFKKDKLGFKHRIKLISQYIRFVHCYTFSKYFENFYPSNTRDTFNKHDFRKKVTGISRDLLMYKYSIRDTNILASFNLLFRTGYSSTNIRKCRRYTIPNSVYNGYINDYNKYNHNHDNSASVVVDLATIKDINDLESVDFVVVKLSKKSSKSLIKKSLTSDKRKIGYIVPQNISGINDYINKETDTIKRAIAINYLKHLNDVGLEIDGYMFYISIYNEQEGGRWSEIEVPFQNMPTEFKRYALSGLQYNNYDIKKCHPTIITEVLSLNNKSSEKIGRYARGEISRENLAIEIFGSQDAKYVNLVKAIINGLIYGMSLRRKEGALYMLLMEAGINAREADFYRKKISLVMADLINDLSSFNEVVRGYLNDNKIEINNEIYIKLPNGKHYHVLDKKIYYNFLKIRYHFITSYESSAIQHICNGIENSPHCTVLVNMHDGLITLGQIPSEVISSAKKESLFKTFELEIKLL